MANMNTFAQVQDLPGPIATAETAVASLATSTVRATVGIPQDVAGGLFDGHPILVRGLAKAIGTGAGNFTFNIYWNSGGNTNLTTFTNDVLLIGNGTVAVGSKPTVSFLEGLVMWDSSTNQLMGVKTRSYNNIVGSAAPTVPVVTPALTATSPLVAAGTILNVSQIQFFATFTSSANISSTTLLELALEEL